MRSDCPAAAAAWSLPISFGRARYPSFSMPSAIAPLDTTTNALLLRAAIASARRANTPLSAASVLDPILMTTRLARATAARASAIGVREQLVECRIEPAHESIGDARDQPDQAVQERRRRVALVVDRGGLFGRHRLHRQRAYERSVERSAHSPCLLGVDAHRPLGPADVEIAVEQM